MKKLRVIMSLMPKAKLLIVESPTKAKTISRFLGSNYKVSSCMGHIRDLPESAKDIPAKYKKEPWKNLGVNTEKNFEPIYCIPKSKTAIVKSLKEQIKKAGELILATDEDREGESISWHLYQILKPKIPVKRIVFHEITKTAIQSALKNYRQIDEGLVQAQEARRVLDRLVGYSLSPLLWKKITTGLSAGRVQSVAVKLISDREIDRMNFVKTSHFGIEGLLQKSQKGKGKSQQFPSHLHSYESKKIAVGKDFDSLGRLKDKKLLHFKEKQAGDLVQKLKKAKWIVEKVEKRHISRSPKPPFITSTLQQEGGRKLNLSPKQTMASAQKLYEQGLITYMRTDSTSLSPTAIKGIRTAISKIYGKKELVEKTRIYKTKTKGAQEAHEAIRPAGTHFKSPEKTGLAGNELKLYQLIWQRSLACQMKNCEQEQTQIQIKAGSALFFSSGLRIISPGFYKLYKDQDEGTGAFLPALKKGDLLKCLKVESKAKESQPPPRYNEASLIQKLEKEGIGRPSTYAPIISTIQDRGYIQKQNKNLAPTFTALAVTRLLNQHLPDYVDLAFSSKMEKALDDMAIGKVKYIKYLNSIYKGKAGLKNQVASCEKSIDGSKSRTLNFPLFKNINFHVGRFGAYISQKKGGKEIKSSLPKDLFLSDITLDKIEEILKTEKRKDQVFGVDPKTKKKIFIKTGPFGPYLELGDGLKRVSIPKFLPLDSFNMEQALQLLELPKVLGTHPKTKKEIKKSIGRYGPYIVHDGDFRSIPNSEILSLGFKEAVKILSQEKKSRRKSSKKTIKQFTHNKDSLQILEGYSPYIRFKNKNYSLPKGTDPLKLSLKEALQIISKKGDSKKKPTRRKKRSGKKRK